MPLTNSATTPVTPEMRTTLGEGDKEDEEEDDDEEEDEDEEEDDDDDEEEAAFCGRAVAARADLAARLPPPWATTAGCLPPPWATTAGCLPPPGFSHVDLLCPGSLQFEQVYGLFLLGPINNTVLETGKLIFRTSLKCKTKSLI